MWGISALTLARWDGATPPWDQGKGAWVRLAQPNGHAPLSAAMTITEWLLALAAAAFLLAPVAALSLRPIEDRKAAIGTIPSGHASSQVICREGCSIR